MDPFRKDCLLNGLDHIGLTLQKMDTIRDFEAKRSAAAPWLDGATTRVPKIWPVAGMPRYELATPSQDDWAEEGKRLRSAAAPERAARRRLTGPRRSHAWASKHSAPY